MRTLPSPDEVAATLFREKLKNPMIREIFQKKSREGKISLLVHHLIGPETERFAAEPVYAVEGKGYLRSKGVEGVENEAELESYLRGSGGSEYVTRILQLTQEKIDAPLG